MAYVISVTLCLLGRRVVLRHCEKKTNCIMKIVRILLFFAFAFATGSVMAQTSVDFQNANVSEFKKLIGTKGTVLVDVRTPGEFAQGHIEGAINIPLSTVSRKLPELDKEKTYLVYCRSGARSRRASILLSKAGFKVVNLLGGYLAWMRG